LQRSSGFTPIFYVRGLNPPYTEAHIQVVNNIVKALLLQNIDSIIFNYRYKNHQNPNEKKFEQNIPIVYRDEVFHGERKSVAVYSSLMETLATLKFLLIEKNLKFNGRHYVVNIVNCFRYPRVFAKEFLKTPIVLHFYMRKAMMGSLVNIIVDKADKIITSSKSVAHYIEKTYNISERKTEILYPPTDVNFYKPVDKNQARRKLGISEKDKVILYIGNLRRERFPEKIVLQVLQCLVKDNIKIKLLIFAPKTDENIRRSVEIKAKVKKLDLTANVKIKAEDLSEKEKSIIYGGSDVFLFPSLDPTVAVEPPLTVLEAMASGLPIVSNDMPSVREMITDEINGLIVPLKNAECSDLADRISPLLRDDEKITSLSFNARQTIVKKASFAHSCKKLIEIYSQLELAR